METGQRCAAAAIAVAWLVSGCAYTYVAPDGSRHVMGLLHVTLPPERLPSPPAASLRLRTLGLSLALADVGNSFSFGYSDVTLAYVRGDTCVRWPLSSP